MHMKTIFEHIENIKGKPHHIRKRVAFAAAAAGTIVITLVWFVGSISTGGFAIQGSTFADSMGQGAELQNTTGNSGSGVAGAVAALPDASAPAHIEIIDTASSTRSGKQAEWTILPF